jgi:hypothetical protein
MLKSPKESSLIFVRRTGAPDERTRTEWLVARGTGCPVNSGQLTAVCGGFFAAFALTD